MDAVDLKWFRLSMDSGVRCAVVFWLRLFFCARSCGKNEILPTVVRGEVQRLLEYANLCTAVATVLAEKNAPDRRRNASVLCLLGRRKSTGHNNRVTTA